MTIPGADSLTKSQCSLQTLAFQHASKPFDLVRWLEKGVSHEDVDMLLLDDILDLADRFGRDVPDSLQMLWNRHIVVCEDQRAPLR